MEGVPACQASHVVVLLQGIDTYGASITRGPHAFGWKRRVNVVVLIIVVM
jgi:hypothetical protein